MISKSAVREFMARRLESYEWIKTAGEHDVAEAIGKIFPRPHFVTPPRPYQMAAFYLGVCRPWFLFFLDMGTGKTKLVLDLIDHHIRARTASRFLVLVPNEASIDSWVEQAMLHQPALRVSALYGSSNDRDAAFQFDESDLFVINYDGFSRYVSAPVKTGKGKNKLVVQQGILDRLAGKFDGIVLDEIHLVKNPRTLRFQSLKPIAEKCVVRYGLTGTPTGRDLQDLWAQFNLIDGGETFGRTQGIYRAAYFREKVNYWGGYEYTPLPDAVPQISHAVKNRSIRYELSECLGMPELVTTVRRVGFPIDTYKYYERVLAEIRQAGKDLSKIEGVFVKMRMLASGFLSVEGDGPKKTIIDFADNPKLDELRELIQELPETSKLVIFHEFTHSGELICKVLSDLKVKHVWLYGGTKDKVGAVREFCSVDKCKVLVANSRLGAVSLNLQVANYYCFFESPVSPITRDQACRRCYRSGQTKTTFQIDLVVKNSVEEKILQYIGQGKDLLKALLSGEEKLG